MLLPKNTSANFFTLLAQGQRVDWQYSLIMILIIGGLSCTPLILGSIRNRAYVVHKREVETTNNAREIRIRSAGERSKAHFDDALIAQLTAAEPKVVVLGNYSNLIMDVVSPRTLQVTRTSSLVPGDPRIEVFEIETVKPGGLGLTDIIVSDNLGRQLYGSDVWDQAWIGGTFSGPPLELNFGDRLIGSFKIVGHQKRKGDALFFSPALGSELRRFSDGLGSINLQLPGLPALLENALPKLRTNQCLLQVPSICNGEVRDNLLRDLRSRQHQLQDGSMADPFLPKDHGGSYTITMMEKSDRLGTIVIEPVTASCSDFIGPVVINRCPQATLMQITTAKIKRWVPDLDGEGLPTDAFGIVTEIFGISPELLALLQGQLVIDSGKGLPIVPKSLANSGVLQIMVPTEAGLSVDQPFEIEAGGVRLPARVSATYRCDSNCLWFADSESTFRLANLADDSVEVLSLDPLSLRPKRADIEYDEVLVYASSVEEVMGLSKRLADLLGPDYAVSPNANAIDNLNRDNARLQAIFVVTVAFAIVFLLLSLASLSKINVDRRNRQMAQLLILGVSRTFVRVLVLSEYLLITVLAALFALCVSVVLCTGLRTLLLGGYLGEIPTDASFQRVVNAMEIDSGMFLQLLGGVIAFSAIVAGFVARSASRADPLNLLD